MTNALLENIKSIPPVTRFFTISTVLACLGVTTFSAFPSLYINLGELLKEYALVRAVVRRGSYFDIFKVVATTVLGWYRFVTSFMVPPGIMSPNRINALFDTYFFYTFSNHLEAHEGKFKGNFPDYLWFIILCGSCIQVSNLALEAITGNYSSATYFPHENLLACLTYVWSRSLKNARINLLGLIPIKAYYLPLGNLTVKLILGGPVSLIDTLVGIISGYLYLCVQSNTMPIYNLLPGAYGMSKKKRNDEGRRVGMTHVDTPSHFGGFQADYIDDSIYDKGYLKAPQWLYNLLSYPNNTSVRTTAFTPGVGASNRVTTSFSRNQPQREVTPTGSTTGYSWFGGSGTAFKGKGHRLGD
ncbi:hypothetical protein CANMA_003537 [Candida margitis]|uniref:uncharacterized protein n=1 Tax=Candida margitis TaxID=1775924 RepID=UPI002227A7AE|nr:uncharacterized protein CANMA_003537 [Candida margitis]KAI5963940.1 hypothetical protein CANMA_003537 [Candida margitis]